MAHYDGLTGLPNRYLFEDYVHNAIAQARRTGEGFAIMVVDLDGFKAPERHLRSQGRRQNAAARLATDGRDGPNQRHGGTLRRRRVRGSGARRCDIGHRRDRRRQDTGSDRDKTLQIDGHDVSLTASIGIILYPANQTEIDPLLRKVDSAMRRIKHRGHNDFHFFSDAVREESEENFRIQNGLRQAISDGNLRVQYQPQIDITSGAVVGVEALARWTDPVFGNVPPSQFIPIAENSGLIHELGERVLFEACSQGRDWIDKHGVQIRVGVNVSVRQLRHRGFSDTVARILDTTGFPASSLELELTETVFIDDANEVLPTLNDLADMGVFLAVDDFGTRYASLMYIKLFPVHRLKIDQTFVKDLPEDVSAAQIVTAIISLARSLGCGIIAEGVETLEQMNFLSDKGSQRNSRIFMQSSHGKGELRQNIDKRV